MNKKKSKRDGLSFGMIDIAKYSILFILIIYIAILVLQNGSSNTTFGEIEKAVTNAMNVSEMKLADGQEFKRFYGLNFNAYEDVCFYYTNETMGVKELLLVKVKQPDQMKELEDAVAKRIETQKTNFDGYGEEQMKLLSKAVVKRKGNLLLFVVSPETEQVQKAFLKAL